MNGNLLSLRVFYKYFIYIRLDLEISLYSLIEELISSFNLFRAFGCRSSRKIPYEIRQAIISRVATSILII